MPGEEKICPIMSNSVAAASDDIGVHFVFCQEKKCAFWRIYQDYDGEKKEAIDTSRCGLIR